jgi:hypothetical protein
LKKARKVEYFPKFVLQLLSVGRLDKLLKQKFLKKVRKIEYWFSKNGVRIAVGRLVKVLISNKADKQKYTPYYRFKLSG